MVSKSQAIRKYLVGSVAFNPKLPNLPRDPSGRYTKRFHLEMRARDSPVGSRAVCGRVIIKPGSLLLVGTVLEGWQGNGHVLAETARYHGRLWIDGRLYKHITLTERLVVVGLVNPAKLCKNCERISRDAFDDGWAHP